MMFDQAPYNCRMEWGKRAARDAAERGDITIIVDVLSFSSTVTTALHYASVIFPYPPPINEQAEEYARRVDAELLLGRAEAAKLGKPSLSPVTFGPQHAGKRFVLCSLNGAACSWLAQKVPALLVGCLLNASAVAERANHVRQQTGANITVVACGEHWERVQADDNGLRPAIEDYLGAGAILSKLDGTKSPEAEVCIGAFQHSQPKINQLLWECGSGRELRQSGFGEDVSHSARIDVYESVPFLYNDHFIEFPAKGAAK